MYVRPYSPALRCFLTSVQKIHQTRVLLFSKAKDIPLMWKVLANKYRDDFAFANHRDRKGKSSEALGYDAGTHKESKILVYPAGLAKPFLFEGTGFPFFSSLVISNISAGLLKYNSISKFFNSILDGTANLTVQNSQVPEDSHMPTPEEQEIERKQEAQRLALLHGGFSDIIDFENAIKEHGTDFHGAHRHTPRSGETDPVILEHRTPSETAHPFATTNMEAPPRASETGIPESVTHNVAPSRQSPVSEGKAFPTHEKDSTPESGHVKDEL